MHLIPRTCMPNKRLTLVCCLIPFFGAEVRQQYVGSHLLVEKGASAEAHATF